MAIFVERPTGCLVSSLLHWVLSIQEGPVIHPQEKKLIPGTALPFQPAVSASTIMILFMECLTHKHGITHSIPITRGSTSQQGACRRGPKMTGPTAWITSHHHPEIADLIAHWKDPLKLQLKCQLGNSLQGGSDILWDTICILHWIRFLFMAWEWKGGSISGPIDHHFSWPTEGFCSSYSHNSGLGRFTDLGPPKGPLNYKWKLPLVYFGFLCPGISRKEEWHHLSGVTDTDYQEDIRLPWWSSS